MQEAATLVRRGRTNRGPVAVDDRLSFRVRQLSELSGVSEPQLYVEIASGRLKAVRKGRLLLILKEDALQWLRESNPAA